MKRFFALCAVTIVLLGLAGAVLSHAVHAAQPGSAPRPASNPARDSAPPQAPDPTCRTYQFTTQPFGTVPPGQVDLGNHCDDCTTPLALPFPVAFYGQTY